jgi:hypothetical protein
MGSSTVGRPASPLNSSAPFGWPLDPRSSPPPPLAWLADRIAALHIDSDTERPLTFDHHPSRRPSQRRPSPSPHSPSPLLDRSSGPSCSHATRARRASPPVSRFTRPSRRRPTSPVPPARCHFGRRQPPAVPLPSTQSGLPRSVVRCRPPLPHLPYPSSRLEPSFSLHQLPRPLARSFGELLPPSVGRRKRRAHAGGPSGDGRCLTKGRATLCSPCCRLPLLLQPNTRALTALPAARVAAAAFDASLSRPPPPFLRSVRSSLV